MCSESKQNVCLGLCLQRVYKHFVQEQNVCKMVFIVESATFYGTFDSFLGREVSSLVRCLVSK